MTPLAIINHLTKNGRHGMISRHKVDHIRATIETDISVYSIRPTTRESACQAAVNMLAQRRRDKKDIDFIFLFLIPFVLFRAFDILKPWPINWLDSNIKGALGVMIDDVAAALFAVVCQYVIVFLIVNFFPVVVTF